jgi:hypothetical protein
MFPSRIQEKVFSNQQKTRISTNNDVVTGNNAREQSKNKVSKQKNVKENMANIEPFSQQNSLNGNNNYTPVSKKDIASDDARIRLTNKNEKEQTQNTIYSYSQVSNNLNKFQQGVTDEAKAYNNINKNPSLLNQNYTTADGKNIRVNNAGVINTLKSAPILSPTPGINISTSIANPPPEVNYIPVENIPAGLTSGPDTGLYGQQLSATSVLMPSGISGYELEGENVFVVYPYPNGVAAIQKNMSYLGAYTSVGGLNPDKLISPNTTLVCIQRAVDQGFTACGMTEILATGSAGNSMIGNLTSYSNYAYNTQSVYPTNFGLTFPPGGYNSLTFGADGVLYAGFEETNLFLSKLTSTFNSNLHPTYGGTINNLVASYAYNRGEWQNLTNFPGNSDPTGQSSGTFNTLYQHDVSIPNEGLYEQPYYNASGGVEFEIPTLYKYYTTQTETQLAAPNTAGGNLVYINHNCGNNSSTKNLTNASGVNAGRGFSVDCSELYNQYPSFNMSLTDAGLLTISNNNSGTNSPNVTFNMSFGYPSQVTLSNGQLVTLNMPRSEWVNGSINGGNSINSYSMNTPFMKEGQWISSPKGFCILILTGGKLVLQYSLQNVLPDTDGNLIGVGSSIALYSIQSVNASNLGMSAHIDINGAVNPYPQSMVGYDNIYTEMKGYTPNTNILNKPTGIVIENLNDEQCRIACNNSNDPSSTCAGYVVYNGNCNLLSADQIFPTGGGRMPNPNYSTYIRNPKFPNTDKSCRKTLDVVTDSHAYSYYLVNGITPQTPISMTANTKCNLGKVLDNQMKELEIKNQLVVQKGQQVKDDFNNLFDRENYVLNSISANRKKAKDRDNTTKTTNDKIQDIENAQITKSAAEKDSELLLVSDNYKYVIWGIVSLLLSIATIKGLRVASS